MAEKSEANETFSEETIRKALDEVRARIANAARQRTEFDRVIAGAREEERLLLRLLALRGGAIDEVTAQPEVHETRSELKVSDARHPSVQTVVEVLEAAGRPLHISELMRVLRERRVPVPGAGTQANLIAHLRRDRNIVRPSRGMYGLAKWGLESMAVPKRHRRRRKRVRVTASDRRTET